MTSTGDRTWVTRPRDSTVMTRIRISVYGANVLGRLTGSLVTTASTLTRAWWTARSWTGPAATADVRRPATANPAAAATRTANTAARFGRRRLR